MSCIGCYPDVFRIGKPHRPPYVSFPFQRSPDMWVGRQSDSHRNRLSADFVDSVGESLELIIAWTARRTAAHIYLPMVTPERLQKVTCERYMIGNCFGNLRRIDEIGRLAHLTIGCVDESDSGIIENPLELQRVFPVFFDGIPVRLDSLQPQCGDSFDCPNNIVLAAPDRARGPEQNVRINGVERATRSRAPHL